MYKTGDSLDDGFDLRPYSGDSLDDGIDIGDSFGSGDDEVADNQQDVDVNLVDDEAKQPVAKKGIKEASIVPNVVNGTTVSKEKKKKKKNKRKATVDEVQQEGGDNEKNAKKSKVDNFKKKDEADDLLISISKQGQFDYLWAQEFVKDHKELTDIEMEPYRISVDNFRDLPSDYSEYRNKDDMQQLLKTLVPSWEREFSEKTNVKRYQKFGHPSIIIICSGALRALEIIKQMPELQKMCNIAKLFSRHMKVKDQVSVLNTKMFRIVVGTPNRLHKLFYEQALSLENCCNVVLDCKRDSKLKTMISQKETRADLFMLLKTFIFPGLKSSKNGKLILY